MASKQEVGRAAGPCSEELASALRDIAHGLKHLERVQLIARQQRDRTFHPPTSQEAAEIVHAAGLASAALTAAAGHLHDVSVSPNAGSGAAPASAPAGAEPPVPSLAGRVKAAHDAVFAGTELLLKAKHALPGAFATTPELRRMTAPIEADVEAAKLAYYRAEEELRAMLEEFEQPNATAAADMILEEVQGTLGRLLELFELVDRGEATFADSRAAAKPALVTAGKRLEEARERLAREAGL